jgi:hypothetical protein
VEDDVVETTIGEKLYMTEEEWCEKFKRKEEAMKTLWSWQARLRRKLRKWSIEGGLTRGC